MLPLVPVVKIPAPLPHQREILEASARFKVACCGRRFGKTVLGLIAVLAGHGPGRMFRGALQGARGMWAGHVDKNTNDIWKMLKFATAGCWVEKSESYKTIVFPSGGEIRVCSAHEPDNLRGPGLDFLVLDEAAFMAEEAWTEVTRPMLSDRQGWAIFISTPCGQNWFWQRFEASRVTPGWRRWQRPSTDNPRVTTDEMRAARLDMGSITFAQEHLAEFVAPGGALFPRERARFYVRDDAEDGGPWTARVLDEPDYFADPLAMTRFVTVDTAASTKTTADYTSIACWGLDPHDRLFLLDIDLRRLPGPRIMDQIRSMCRRWTTVAYVEDNATSKHLLSFMDEESVPYKVVEPGSVDKRTRALPASAMWERGAVVLPVDLLPRRDDPDYEAEREHMIREAERQLFTFTGARDKPGQKTHDDVVDCLAYAVRVVREELSAGAGLVALPGVTPRERTIAGLTTRRPPGM